MQRKPRLRPTVLEILDYASARMDATLKYFRTDRTMVIYSIHATEAEHIRLTSLSLKDADPRDALLCRLCGARSLALEEQQLFPRQEATGSLPRTFGTGSRYLRRLGLQGSALAKDSLRLGQILLRIETSTRVPGISLVLLPVLPQIQSLRQEEEHSLVQLLIRVYSEMIYHGKKLSPDLVGPCGYQASYNDRVCDGPHAISAF